MDCAIVRKRGELGYPERIIVRVILLPGGTSGGTKKQHRNIPRIYAELKATFLGVGVNTFCVDIRQTKQRRDDLSGTSKGCTQKSK
jgi:hypothetical protein